MIYGERRQVTGIDGIELLKEGAGVAAARILTDEDLRKIRIAKLREAAQTVDKAGFKESSDEEDGEELDVEELSSMPEDGDEAGEDEISENSHSEEI